MSSWIESLDEIYKILEKYDLKELKSELYEKQLSGGTGWEIFLLVTDKLRDLESSYPYAYDLIKKEVDEIFSYGIKNGFLSKR